MLSIALDMLFGNKTKLYAAIFGVAFSTLLITQQGAIFCGAMLRTTAHIREVKDAPIWVMNRETEFLDDAKPLPDEDLYRGARLVNWDPVLHTALSDLEVLAEPEQGHLWHFRYPLADGSGHLVVATTRPETMLGDTAVAVNPEDERYRYLVGRQIRLPLTLAIMAALLVEVDGRPFAIPLDRIERTVRLADHTVRSVAGSRMLVMRDGVLPIVDAAERFGGSAAPEAEYPVVVPALAPVLGDPVFLIGVCRAPRGEAS